MKTYEVGVEVTYLTFVTVEAKSLEAACQLAEDKARRDCPFEIVQASGEVALEENKQ